ncbi:ATP-dependent Clp protease proteolytic subunit [Solwaraspora sp. WMMD1047]|uniref:ATP-dependent Clp protease proteolytic subunit n=1 Tax=Solwaraspora sp. WMMD1047 TaxID=3016102 RepID=UPI0024166321|nr:ATP-dependent Clp protease proteolytic subunit [Solwaraspora sp. WMMD1047]MDG4828179.1 ATP-dependent Clp protease proteolytic subunit [Solwaraspora sp. WMMD1047]
MAEAPSPFDEEIFDRLLRERIIFLRGEVTEPVANAICAQLLLLAADGAQDIQFFINSPGGSVSGGLAIYDAMRFIRNDVATIAVGAAGSMGQFLLCAGTAGKRYALPHARIMMHQPSGGFGGTVSDIRTQTENLLHAKRTLRERIAFHTGRSVEEIERDSDRDRWFTPEQAKEYGIIDAVLSSVRQVATATG